MRAMLTAMQPETVASAVAKHLKVCSCESLGSRAPEVSLRVAAYGTSGFKRAFILAGDGQWIKFANFQWSSVSLRACYSVDSLPGSSGW